MTVVSCVFLFFKQKTAYEMRISDWSSDVCSSDLASNARSGANVLTLKSPPTEKGILFARHAMAVFAAKGNMHEAAQIAKTHYGDESPVTKAQIGRASCRERVCQYVEISVVHGS